MKPGEHLVGEPASVPAWTFSHAYAKKYGSSWAKAMVKGFYVGPFSEAKT